MDLMSFQKLRDGLQLNVAPAPHQARAAAVERLCSALVTSGVFADVEIEPTGDRDRLVAGLCRYSAGQSEEQIIDRLTRIWSAELRYHGWDAHSFLVDEGHVELQAATAAADRSRYLTLHLIAQADPTLADPTLADPTLADPTLPNPALADAGLAPADSWVPEQRVPEPRAPEQRGWLRRALARDVA